jgi:hypothetical protein
MTPKLPGLALFSLVLLAGQALAGPTTPPLTTGKSGSVDSGVRTVLGDRAPKVPGRPAVAPLPNGGYRLIWTDMSTDETGFMIERYPAFAEGPTRLVGANISELVDTQDLPKARYRVRAMGERLHSRWTTWAQGTSMAAGFVSLTPGGGFSGPTPQPPAVGTSEMAGYDAKAIARWDVVPYETFTGTFHVGVVAFHINGIDRVEFSVNGGPWKAVREMKRNPRTNVWEYTAILKASNFADGPVEVRAVVYPNGAGVPRVLGGEQARDRTDGCASTFLFANAHGTNSPVQVYVATTGSDTNSGLTPQQPKRTLNGANGAMRIAADHPMGGTVNILDGSVWEIGNTGVAINNTRFVTIRGLGARNTTLRPLGAVQSPWSARGFLWPQIKRVKYENVGFDFSYIKQLTSSENDTVVWLDNCRIFSSNGWTEPSPVTYFSTSLAGGGCGYYATNSLAEDCVNGFTDHVLVRGCHNFKISGDVFQNSRMVVDSSVDWLTQDISTGQHTDIFQQFRPGQPIENIIGYDVRCSRMYGVQNFYSDSAASFRDIAYVNIAIQNLPVPRPYQYIDSELNVASQWSGVYNHVLFMNVSCPGRRILFHDQLDFASRNFKMINCVFEQVQDGQGRGGLPGGIEAINCHANVCYQGVPWGIGTTFGTSQGDVELQFAGYSQAGGFLHTGDGAQSLVGTGQAVRGFGMTRSRGAFVMTGGDAGDSE